MPKSSISFQVLPCAKTDEKNIKIIDKVIGMVQRSGINYKVGPMETTMEGDLDAMIEIVKKAQYLCIKEGAGSVFTNVKILYKPKGIMTIGQKVGKYR